MKNKNKIKTAMSVAAAYSLIVIAPLSQVAQADITAPIGYLKLTFKAQSDTPFSLPLNRPKVYSGQADSISENTINIAAQDFTASQFVYADGSQNEKFYLLFTTGILEGRTFDVTANGTNSITVNQDGDTDIETLINDTNANDNFEIRPHWTLGTAFPDGTNIPKTTNFNNIQVLIQFRTLQTGTNIPITLEYTYFDSSTNDSLDGWYLPNSPQSGKKDDVILMNNTFYVFRNNSNNDFNPSVVGDVPTVDFSNNLMAHVVENDNYKTIAFPIPLTLAESKLVESGAFQPTQNISLRDGDTLQVYTYPITGFNQPISTEYIYFDSTNNAVDGWYFPNNPQAGKQDAVTVFQPGRGYIIRTTERMQETNTFWKTPMPYNPFAE